MEPSAQRVVDPDRPGFAGQQEECGLKGVLRVVHILEHAMANRDHHRPVALYQGLEGRLVALGGVSFQEPGIRKTRQGALAKQSVNVPQCGAELCLPLCFP